MHSDPVIRKAHNSQPELFTPAKSLAPRVWNIRRYCCIAQEPLHISQLHNYDPDHIRGVKRTAIHHPPDCYAAMPVTWNAPLWNLLAPFFKQSIGLWHHSENEHCVPLLFATNQFCDRTFTVHKISHKSAPPVEYSILFFIKIK